MGVRNKKRKETRSNNIRDLIKIKGYKAIDSFCGPGGMSLGLKRAGFDVFFAFDNNEQAVATYNLNIANHAAKIDVKEIDAEKLLKKYNFKIGELDLFSGGPPCQGFSKQKRGAHLGDNRNDFVLDYIKLVKELQPRFFLFENVAIFGQKRGTKYVSEMHSFLKNYVLNPHFYNSADYGLAQTRERFIIVGVRNDQKCNFSVPKPTVKCWRTVGEVLNEFPEPPDDFSVHPKYPNHQKARVTDINIKRFSFVPQGGGWQDIPEEYQLDCHKKTDRKKGGWPDVYGRLEWSGQCPTITGGFDSFTRGRYGHPLHDRPLTPREAAKIQGFPNDFIFLGTRADVRSQIGNAVPPPLAEIIGVDIGKCLLIADDIIKDDMDEVDDAQEILLSNLAN